MELRQYQLDAANAAIKHVRSCLDSCLIEAPTGSGKSWIAAYIAKNMLEISKKRILVLAPSGELVEQNYKKYIHTGEKASIFCASKGRKELRNSVVFGSPLTVLNKVSLFSDFSTIIVDEAHGVTPTLKKIIYKMKQFNVNTRVIGMTATPYRLGEGFIYQYDENNIEITDCKDPYFFKKVYSISAKELVNSGFLTKPITTATLDHYDTSGLVLKKNGLWDSSTVDKAFVGLGRKTSAIVSDIVEKSKNRNGVIVFAATIQHAHEIISSLPKEISALVTGETSRKERECILSDFNDKKLKYLVNVAVLTTGFDAPHIDVVAILRPTESAALFQQIVGRGLRIFDDKKDCLILDYAENMDRLLIDGDFFRPKIQAGKDTGDAELIKVVCKKCRHENHFSKRENKDQFKIDNDGDFIDLAGNKIGIPAHYGRRCEGLVNQNGHLNRCDYRFAGKTCEKCNHYNDIAARFCEKCKAEIVDPNNKLTLQTGVDNSAPITSKIAFVNFKSHTSKNGNECIIFNIEIDYKWKYGSIDFFFMPKSEVKTIRRKFLNIYGKIVGGIGFYGYLSIDEFIDELNKKKQNLIGKEITYYKNNGFYELINIDMKENDDNRALRAGDIRQRV